MSGEIRTPPPLRIVTAAHEPDLRVHYQTVLPALGHRLLSTTATGRELIERCHQHGPDLVIADSKLSDMDVIEAAQEVCRRGPVPFVVTADHFDREQIKRQGADHFWAYLMKPISREHLEAVIPFVATQFKKMRALVQELEALRFQARTGPCPQPEVG